MGQIGPGHQSSRFSPPMQASVYCPLGCNPVVSSVLLPQGPGCSGLGSPSLRSCGRPAEALEALCKAKGAFPFLAAQF